MSDNNKTSRIVAMQLEAVEKDIEKNKTKKDVVYFILCPKCKSTLGYMVSSTNGHKKVNCSNPKCVSWME